MKKHIITYYSLRFIIAIICCVSLLILSVPVNSFSESPSPAAVSQVTLRLGERIYREGVLPSGKPLQASIKGGSTAPGITFACISCHLRGGLGAYDEGVYTPPINDEMLFRPPPRLHKGIEQSPKSTLLPLRPGYTEESLINLLRNGIDPKGRVLNEVMPRYLLEESDAKLLIAYLRSLSSQFSPGISDTNISFATVISEDVPLKEREAMLATLENFFTIKNNQSKVFTDPRWFKSRLMAEKMVGSRDLATKSMSLSKWVVKGPSETWRSQLEEYYRKEPVFALLGGITKGDWKPVHRFSEENRIPCIFPNTDLPVVSDTDWYTLYLSKGYYQEGESAARYLNGNEKLLKGKPLVQIVRDSLEAEALAEGFQQTWKELGQQAPVTVKLPAGKKLTEDLLQQLLDKDNPAVMLIWDDASALPAIEKLNSNGVLPKQVFLSGRYLGESLWTLNESIRDVTYLTYPFSFTPSVAKAAMGKQQVKDDLKKTMKQVEIPLKDEVRKIESLTNSLTQMLTYMLIDLKGNYYRENLLDVTGMMEDQQYPLYGRISFGTGQRYASKGCFIVQLSHGDNPELVKKSSWIIQ